MKNVYTCKVCGHKHWTVNRDDGVTPMFLTCRGKRRDGSRCRGTAVSAMYGIVQGSPTLPEPEWEWYRPELGDPLMRDPDTAHHVAMGGLVLRRIRQVGGHG